MKLYFSEFREKEYNTKYPYVIEVKGLDAVKRAAGKDHIFSRMKNATRSRDNFIEADCIIMDLDNTHSEDPAEWKTLDDISDALEDVTFYYIQSRNYMKEKSKYNKATNTTVTYAAREKYHLYFPLSEPINNLKELQLRIMNIVALFPYFDRASAEPAHFFYGVENPQGGQIKGELCIDEYIKKTPQSEFDRRAKANLKEFASRADASNDEVQKTISTLTGFLGLTPEAPAPTTTTPAQQITADEFPEGVNWISTAHRDQSYHWFKNWAQAHEVTTGTEYQINDSIHNEALCICVKCPWENEHTTSTGEKETVVIIDKNGQLNFLCRHSHGYKLKWPMFRAYYESKETAHIEQGYQEHKEQLKKDVSEKTAAAPAVSEIKQFLTDIQTEKFRPYKTDVKFFDDLLGGGVVKESLLLLMAAPGTGKTTLCMQLSESLAEKGTPVIYLNLEMSRNQMLSKAISYHLAKDSTLQEKDNRMTASEILQGYNWKEDEETAALIRETVNKYEEKIYPYLRYNPDGVGNDMDDIKKFLDKTAQECREKKTQAPVIVLDYLHLVTWRTDHGHPDIKEIIKEIVTTLKDYAANNNTFVIAISAIARNKAGNLDMFSGRDSSNLEYTGDYVLSLDYKKNKNDPDDETAGRPDENGYIRMKLKLEKSRHSEANKAATIYFDGAYNTFYSEDEWRKASANNRKHDTFDFKNFPSINR